MKLVAKLQKVQDLASFIPLFLHGDALALYLEMSNEDQVRAEQMEMRLVTAFAEGSFEAYEKLKRFKWTGESIDVYANTIKRLAGLAEYIRIGLDHTAKLAFVTGFPDDVSVALVIFSVWWQGKDKHKLKVLNNYINKKETQSDKMKNLLYKIVTYNTE